MAFIGLIFMFLLLWIVLMGVMIPFAAVCIIFSVLSSYRSKAFVHSLRYADFQSAGKRFKVSLVFFILTCVTSLGTVFSFILGISMLAEGMNFSEEIGAFLFFMISPALFVAALILGIRCFSDYSKARKLQSALHTEEGRIYVTARTYVICPACGANNDDFNNFCVSCGATLK